MFHTIARAKEARLIDDAIVCSPEPLEVPDGILNYAYTNGNECDVLERYYYCLQRIPCDYVVRLTADCPLLDPHLIDFVVDQGLSAGADYCSNVVKLTFPDGVDCELISGNLIAFLHATVKAPYHREHVTSILRDQPELQEQFNMVSVESETDYSRMKWSIDTPEDLKSLRGMEAEFFK